MCKLDVMNVQGSSSLIIYKATTCTELHITYIIQ